MAMKSYFYKMSTLLVALFGNFVWANDAANASEGEYLARAGDCMACHTNDENKPYAGGHGLVSPIGTIYATNITPDKIYGIGNYTYENFEQALRHGEKPSGDPLYPAMPFVSYAKMSDADVHALYDYFMNEVQPIAEPNLPTDIEWPLNIRFPMSIWIALLTDSREYIPQPDQSDEWNRGAYLVQGLGHCGTCHTPRSVALVEQGLDEMSETFLSGAQLGGWYAPNLRTLRENDDQELFRLLKEGRNTQHAFAGPMSDVTTHSLSHLTDEDIHSMIVYLRSIQLPSERVNAIVANSDKHSEGYGLYQEYCSACHGIQGEGVQNVAPLLANRGNGEQGRTLNVAQVILSGTESVHNADRIAYQMPAYKDKFNNEEIAQLTNFIMHNSDWQNYNDKITAEDIQKLKEGEPPMKGWPVIIYFIDFLGILIVVGLFWSYQRSKKAKRSKKTKRQKVRK